MRGVELLMLTTGTRNDDATSGMALERYSGKAARVAAAGEASKDRHVARYPRRTFQASMHELPLSVLCTNAVQPC